jgi:hypothetical protein
VRSRTSCKVLDVPTLFRRPTAPQLAAFILPSVGRLASPPWPHRQTCEKIRHSAKDGQATHHGLRSDDLGTNRLSAGTLVVVGKSLTGPVERVSPGARSRFCSSADMPFGCVGFAGNKPLDHPRSRSSGVSAGADRAACGPGVSVSDATSLPSEYASFGISKFGVLPFSTVARTVSANLLSGRSHEPR